MKKILHTHIPTKLAENKGQDKKEELSSSRRSVWHLLSTAQRFYSRFLTCSSDCRGAGSEGRVAGVGRGRRRRPALPAPGSHTAPRHPPVLSSLPAAEVSVPARANEEKEGKIWIKQSPLRNGRRRKCQCRVAGGRVGWNKVNLKWINKRGGESVLKIYIKVSAFCGPGIGWLKTV